MIWTQEQKKLFANSFVLTAKNYDKDLDFDLAKMVTEDLEDLGFEECMKALVAYRRNPQNKFWPKASDIREIVMPTINGKDAARETSMRIVQSVSKFGYMQGSEARTFVGELGWVAIERIGGWQYVCTNLGVTLDVGTFIAQIRDLLESQANLRKLGHDLDQPVQILGSNNKMSGAFPKLESAADILKNVLVSERGQNGK